MDTVTRERLRERLTPEVFDQIGRLYVSTGGGRGQANTVYARMAAIVEDAVFASETDRDLRQHLLALSEVHGPTAVRGAVRRWLDTRPPEGV